MKNVRDLKLKDHFAFEISFRAWGNYRKADKSKISTESESGETTDKEMLRLTKKLLDSPEYDAIISHQNKTKQWIANRSVPAFIHKGVYLFSTDMVNEVEQYIETRKNEEKSLVSAFVLVYEQRKEDARIRLGNQFSERDYPEAEYIRSRFNIDTRWSKFDIPEGLPTDIFKAEKEKAEKSWQEATIAIQLSLREAFKKLVSHAADRLKPDSDGKTKRLHTSIIENVSEFITTFNNRNLTSDSELAELVEKAKAILEGIEDPEIIRDNLTIREYIGMQFEGISEDVTSLIEDMPIRKFSFD